MFDFLKRLFTRRDPLSATVVVDDHGVSVRFSDGKVEAVAWSELTEVVMVTTDEGPFTEDVFFLLEGMNDTGCCVANGDPASKELLQRLQKLQDFDNGKFIEAMGCAENARFVCWRKKGA